MNETIDYYNSHAEEYFSSTSQADLGSLYEEFLKHIPAGGRIIDLGCGSGRDVKWFRDHGYDACGLDASEELVKIARERLDIPVEAGNIEEWIAEEPFDGIWCCASLMHLADKNINRFFAHVRGNLKPGGVLFASVKTGIETGYDSAGRYMKNFTEKDIRDLAAREAGLYIISLWYTGDSLSRSDFKWLNFLVGRNHGIQTDIRDRNDRRSAPEQQNR